MSQILRKKHRLSDGKIIVISFLLLILAGTILLAMPFSLRAGKYGSFLTALFTATSAICVTGLSVVDVWSTYSAFGQLVILCLIQIGGLGFMSLMTTLYHLVRHRTDITDTALLAESLGTSQLAEISRIHKHLMILSLAAEGIGTCLLALRFIPEYGILCGLWFSIFHSVSAFCNAGFDLMGIRQPGSSMILYQKDFLVSLTLAILIIIGGIGFFVWDELITKRSFRRLTVYSKIVFWTTGLLIVFGSALFLLFEFTNPDTMAGLSLPEKCAGAFFQAVTPRTAGFATFDQAALTESSQVLTAILMLIGGSAGSTAGGIKTVTLVIVLSCVLSSLQGKRQVLLYHRRISDEQIRQAASLLALFSILCIFGGFYLTSFSSLGFFQAFFESVSALATVGLSLGVTASLSVSSRLLIILYMFLGRVGIITVALSLLKKKECSDLQYPSMALMIG